MRREGASGASSDVHRTRIETCAFAQRFNNHLGTTGFFRHAGFVDTGETGLFELGSLSMSRRKFDPVIVWQIGSPLHN